MNTALTSILRHALTAFGAWLAAKGIETGNIDWTAVSGALVTIGGVVWSVWNGFKNRKAISGR